MVANLLDSKQTNDEELRFAHGIPINIFIMLLENQ